MARLVRTQWGVITWSQLTAAELSRHQITYLIAHSRLHRVHRGVYAYGRPDLPPNGVLLAAQLACGRGAYITGRSALGYAKVRGLYLRKIEVGVVGRSARRRPAPLSVMPTLVEPLSQEIRTHGPLRIATVPRALLDLSADATSDELSRLITDAIHLKKLDHGQMRTLLRRHTGRRGIGALRQAYAVYEPRGGSKSGLERAFDRGRRERPWIPEPAHNVYVMAAGVDWEIDRYWPEYRVGVELHGGGYHQAAADIEKDSFKAAKLLAIGVVLIVVTDTRLELEPSAVYDDVEDVLRARGWLGR